MFGRVLMRSNSHAGGCTNPLGLIADGGVKFKRRAGLEPILVTLLILDRLKAIGGYSWTLRHF
jgi:hypothetical protein